MIITVGNIHKHRLSQRLSLHGGAVVFCNLLLPSHAAVRVIEPFTEKRVDVGIDSKGIFSEDIHCESFAVAETGSLKIVKFSQSTCLFICGVI